MIVLALALDFAGDGDAALAVLREQDHRRPLPRVDAAAVAVRRRV